MKSDDGDGVKDDTGDGDDDNDGNQFIKRGTLCQQGTKGRICHFLHHPLSLYLLVLCVLLYNTTFLTSSSVSVSPLCGLALHCLMELHYITSTIALHLRALHSGMCGIEICAQFCILDPLLSNTVSPIA